ncbi:MAG TPA: hypothetical protein VFJ46_17805 [Xanthobacteraceae bacterium]|nr:hypothetical protein [Xanthobacteraceae bacterium]
MSIPVFFVEPTGKKFYHQGAYCDACNVSTFRRARAQRIPKATYIACRQCGASTRICSAGTDTVYRRPDTGEMFIDHGFRERPELGLPHPNLPAGAVRAAVAWKEEGEIHNWISYVDKDGAPFTDNQIRYLERLHPDDGRVLVCRLPDGHDWIIDSRCNNCTLKYDDVHWCWNRSGRPEDGTLDVRKGKPGQTTCAAGGGSILTSQWHGFLHDGQLRSC